MWTFQTNYFVNCDFPVLELPIVIQASFLSQTCMCLKLPCLIALRTWALGQVTSQSLTFPIITAKQTQLFSLSAQCAHLLAYCICY